MPRHWQNELDSNPDLADRLTGFFLQDEPEGFGITEEAHFVNKVMSSNGWTNLLLLLGDRQRRLAATGGSNYSRPRYKIVFYSPKYALEHCKNAVFEAGAGTLPGSKYSHCSFETTGAGQFLPIAARGANPTIGTKTDDGSGEFKLEKVEEMRCEVVCFGRDIAAKAVAALKRAHPYEEPAYEVHQIEDL